MNTVNYPGAAADLDFLRIPLQERRLLVVEARRVLLGTLQRLGTGVPDKAAADRLRELREWSASALCRLRSGFFAALLLSALQLASLLGGSSPGWGSACKSVGLSDLPSGDCLCRELRVTLPNDAHANSAGNGANSCELCGGWGVPYYLPQDACMASHEQQHTRSLPGKVTCHLLTCACNHTAYDDAYKSRAHTWAAPSVSA